MLLMKNNAYDTKIYSNIGNQPLLDMMNKDCARILDVGCGAGDNAARLKLLNPAYKVFGITLSRAEAQLAAPNLEHCWVADVENGAPGELASLTFDVLIFSHVLEHMRDPSGILASFIPYLRPGGEVLIAVPNVLVWRQRLKFLTGRFEYAAEGVMDETHLRFFTYRTADALLFARTPQLKMVEKTVSASIPLWLLRRYLLPKTACNYLDYLGGRFWPNLFGDQVLIKAVRTA